MRTAQGPHQPVDPVLEDLMNRLSPASLELLFQSTSLTRPSLGRVEYLRKIIRESAAADDNFDALVAHYDLLGMTIGRRTAFKMGCTLALLMSEGIPHNRAQMALVARPAKPQQQKS